MAGGDIECHMYSFFFNFAFKFLIFHRFVLHVMKYLNKLNVRNSETWV